MLAGETANQACWEAAQASTVQQQCRLPHHHLNRTTATPTHIQSSPFQQSVASAFTVIPTPPCRQDGVQTMEEGPLSTAIRDKSHRMCMDLVVAVMMGI